MSSITSDQSFLDEDHAEGREQRQIAELFRAHTSPAFHALVRQRTQTGSGTGLSLATCEKVPTSGSGDVEPSGDSGSTPRKSIYKDPLETVEEIGYLSDATKAIQASISRSQEIQRRVIALIGRGEPAHARRLANCRRKSVQLECPEMGGGCGSDDNYVPINCDSRLCPECMKRKMGKVAQQYKQTVESWDSPTMLRLSLSGRVDPEDLELGVETLRDHFGRLRRRVIPANGEHQGKRWVWKSDGGEPADYYWKQALIQAGRHDLARRWQKRYVSQGKGIPFEEIVTSGFYGIDVKQGEEGTLNVHMHVLGECPYLPQAALAAEWDDIAGAPVVDIRRINDRGEQDVESALVEVIGYAAKPPEFEDVDQEAEYLTALKGSKLIQPFGDLHGNTPQALAELRCCDCEITPAYWNYVGTVRGTYETAVVGSSEDGDRPPPDSF